MTADTHIRVDRQVFQALRNRVSKQGKPSKNNPVNRVLRLLLGLPVNGDGVLKKR